MERGRDNLLEMLVWNRPKDIQEKGLELARKEKDLSIFMNHSVRNGENCAIILSEKDDEELKVYLLDLLDWIIDMNWEGASIIASRLRQFQNIDFLIEKIHEKRKMIGNLPGYKDDVSEMDWIETEIALDYMKKDNPIDLQRKGKELARNVANDNTFIRPKDRKVWKRCIEILLERDIQMMENDDHEELLQWTREMDEEEFQMIKSYLKKIPNIENHKIMLIKEAIEENDYLWKNRLLSI